MAGSAFRGSYKCSVLLCGRLQSFEFGGNTATTSASSTTTSAYGSTFTATTLESNCSSDQRRSRRQGKAPLPYCDFVVLI